MYEVCINVLVFLEAINFLEGNPLQTHNVTEEL